MRVNLSICGGLRAKADARAGRRAINGFDGDHHEFARELTQVWFDNLWPRVMSGIFKNKTSEGEYP